MSDALERHRKEILSSGFHSFLDIFNIPFFSDIRQLAWLVGMEAGKDDDAAVGLF